MTSHALSRRRGEFAWDARTGCYPRTKRWTRAAIWSGKMVALTRRGLVNAVVTVPGGATKRTLPRGANVGRDGSRDGRRAGPTGWAMRTRKTNARWRGKRSRGIRSRMDRCRGSPDDRCRQTWDRSLRHPVPRDGIRDGRSCWQLAGPACILMASKTGSPARGEGP
jgi:hypothetical protein